MSIPVPITKEEVKKITRELKKPQDVICLDVDSHLKTLLVGQSMLLLGKTVKAKIVKGYK